MKSIPSPSLLVVLYPNFWFRFTILCFAICPGKDRDEKRKRLWEDFSLRRLGMLGTLLRPWQAWQMAQDPAVSAHALEASLIWVRSWAPLSPRWLQSSCESYSFLFEDVLGTDRMDPFHSIDKS